MAAAGVVAIEHVLCDSLLALPQGFLQYTH